MKNKFLLTLTVCFISTHLSAVTLNKFELEPYGFLKTSAMYSDQALASFNNVNLSAPTHAVAQTRSQDKTSRFSFQAQQSRIGTTIFKDQLLGRIELDFLDFNKSSPTTQMTPRVRIASVTYQWDNNKVILGQDWDLYSPVNTYTYNYVGSFYHAGNTGFMRQQAQYIKMFNHWELGAALGMAGNNPGITDSDLELGKSPTYAARVLRKINNGNLGLSGIYSTLHFTSTNGSSRDSFGINAFYEQKTSGPALRSEVYYGQNLNNIGALAIGKGTDSKNVREFGGHLTATYPVNEKDHIFGGAGLARTDNQSEVTPFSFGSGNNSNLVTNPGIVSNFVSRLGYEHRITPDFSFISEISRFETNSKIEDDRTQLNIAYNFESGIQFRF